MVVIYAPIMISSPWARLLSRHTDRPQKGFKFVVSNLKTNFPIVNGLWNFWIDFLPTNRRYIVVRYCQMRYIVPFFSKEYLRRPFID